MEPGDGAAFGRIIEEFGAFAGDIFPLFGRDLTSAAAALHLRNLMVRPDGRGAAPFASDFGGASICCFSFRNSPERSVHS